MAREVLCKNICAVFVISLEDRNNRLDVFTSQYDAINWDRVTKSVRVTATYPPHPTLQPGGDFAALTGSLVASNRPNQYRFWASTLSGIMVLRKTESHCLYPAVISKDDLKLTNEGAQLWVPLPSTMVLVIVCHDVAVTTDAPVTYNPENTEALVSAKEYGFKSSCAAYLIQTCSKYVETGA